MKRCLFVTWDGPRQPYLASLFLPILSALAEHGYAFDVMQYTWAGADERALNAKTAKLYGIGYRSRSVLRRPLSAGTAATMLMGGAHLAAEARAYDVVLVRSIIPLAIGLLAMRSDTRWRLVFDADGLPADERVEFAGWNSKGAQYRIFREIEAQGVRTAHSVVTRTERAKEVLLARAGSGVPREKIFVVPNGKDERAFSPGTAADRASTRRAHGIELDAPWLVYVGSLGPQYHLRAMLELYGLVRARCARARLHLLTSHVEAVSSTLAELGMASQGVVACPVAPERVPAYLAAADVGIAFRTPSFSQCAVSPIKIAEYLLCGLPVIATRGAGDAEVHVSQDTGLVVPDLGRGSLERSVSWLFDRVLVEREGLRTSCRALALEKLCLRTCADGFSRALSHAQRVSA